MTKEPDWTCPKCKRIRNGTWLSCPECDAAQFRSQIADPILQMHGVKSRWDWDQSTVIVNIVEVN